MPFNWRRARVVAVTLVALAALALVIDFLRLPWFAVLSALLGVGSFVLFYRRGKTNFVFYYLGFVFLALSLTEVYYAYTAVDGSGSYQHLTRGDVLGLGYGANPGVFRAQTTRNFGTRVIYDVTYAIDGNGLRHTPSAASGPATFFFGGSTVFGEGVNDDETLPFAFAEASGLRAVNFGLNGYGPNQMLRMLELDRPKLAEVGMPRVVVYMAGSDNILHAAGLAPWDQSGPLYESSGDGAVYAGSFRDHRVAYSRSIFEKILRASRTYRALHPEGYALDTLTPDAISTNRQRFLSIMREAKRIAEEKYGARMIALLAPAGDEENSLFKKDDSWMETNLRENGFLVLRIPRFFTSDEAGDWTIPYDGHPNAKYYRQIAQALLAFMRDNGIDLQPWRIKSRNR